MRTLKASLLAVAAAALMPMSGQALAQNSAAQPALKPAVVTTILNRAGDKIGTATLTGGDKSTVIRIAIAAGGLTPGWHAAHFHAVGDCSDTAKFELSKAHVNHGEKKHGFLNPDGPDGGDLPNVYAAADGSVNADLHSATLLDGREGLRDQDGSALIFHENADDYTSQPIGGAGGRIACALIK